MHLPQRWLKERGASVLAALVLVAILGAVFIVLQYARSSGDFAYDSAALMADSAGTGGLSSLTVDDTVQPYQGCTGPRTVGNGSVQTVAITGSYLPVNVKTDTCPCNQPKTTGSDDSGTGASVAEQCLPGCIYKITNVTDTPTVSTAGNSVPSQSQMYGIVESCLGGSCTAAECFPGASVAADQFNPPSLTSSTGAAESSAPEATNPAGTPAQSNPEPLGTLEGSQDIDNALNGSGSNSPIGTTETTNPDSSASGVDTTQTPGSDTGANGPIGTTQAGGSDSSANGPIGTTQASGSGGQPGSPAGTGLNSDTASQIAQPCAITNGQVGTNGVPCSGSTTAPPNPASGCASSGCVDANTNNYGSPNSFPCPTGTTGTPGNCTPAAGPGAPGTPAAPARSASGLGSAGSLATSFLTGLVNGITAGLIAQQASQAQQQAQQAYAPYGTGTDGAACPEPQPEPDPSQCNAGSWQQISQSNGCPTTWQCVPTSASGQQPTAQLSCEPTSADVGMSVSISYSCGNATDSAGGGFVTNDQLSGSTSTVLVAPPSGDNTASYGLTCYNGTVTVGAQCSVQVNQPSIVLVANPSVVPYGSATAIGWVTSDMQSCTLSSPNNPAFTAANANNQSVNGIATTSPITAPMTVELNCVTSSGATQSATASITIGGSAATAPVTVSSSVDGGTIAHGSAVTITWSSVSPPSGSAMSLWLVNTATGATNAVIAGGLSPNGVYTWNTPAVASACNTNASNVCASDLVSGDTYAIEAVLYAPSNAYVGDGTEPSSPVQPTYGSSGVSGVFTVNDGTSNTGD